MDANTSAGCVMQSLFSMRLFTANWDVFTPTENVVYHRYVQYVR